LSLLTNPNSTRNVFQFSGNVISVALSNRIVHGRVGVGVRVAVGVVVAVGVSVGVFVGVDVTVGVGVKEAVGVGPVGVTVGVNVREAVGVGPVGVTVGVSVVGLTDAVGIAVLARGVPTRGVDWGVAAGPAWRDGADDSQATAQPRQNQSTSTD